LPSEKAVAEIRDTARLLAKKLKVVAPAPRAPQPVYRPITGYGKQKRIRIAKTAAKHRPGPKAKHNNRVFFEPKSSFILNLTRREKARWQRAARDLGMPLGAMMRMAMRYFMGSKRMQAVIALGPGEIEYRKRFVDDGRVLRRTRMVGLTTPDVLQRRVNSIIAPDDHEVRQSLPSNFKSPPRAQPDPPVGARVRRMIVPLSTKARDT
jgi:hypothetical protein